jgi:hypothetical protein
MDDHHPAGFGAVKIGAPATVFHEAPSPYAIPYRSLYSRNVPNLMFAGRVASCTHAAMSSTRVMGTGCSMGQAVGVAAALATARGLLPAAMMRHIDELQQTLLRDDAYVPGVAQKFPPALARARLTASSGDPEPVRNGVNRPVGDVVNGWTCGVGDWIAYRFETRQEIESITVVVDSGLDLNVALSLLQDDDQLASPPSVLPKAFRIEGLIGEQWRLLARAERNGQRWCCFPVRVGLDGMRFVLEETWGSPRSRVYAFFTSLQA